LVALYEESDKPNNAL
ncbi:hypothetical protein NL108_005311, partial [Boleophthalmus pectinirostris]